MRWLLCLTIVIAAATEASAKRLVVNEPPMVRRCPSGKTWNNVAQCLAKTGGTVKVIKQLKGAKLVGLSQKQGARSHDLGLLVYVERKGEWHLGGRYEAYNTDYHVLSFEPVTVGKKSGYKLEIGQTTHISLLVDSVTPTPALVRARRVLFCGGHSYHCPNLVLDCEVSVQGKAFHVFRGTLRYEDNAVFVSGDRTRAGVHCATPAKAYLGWP